jgi:hypothetical protein
MVKLSEQQCRDKLIHEKLSSKTGVINQILTYKISEKFNTDDLLNSGIADLKKLLVDIKNKAPAKKTGVNNKKDNFIKTNIDDCIKKGKFVPPKKKINFTFDADVEEVEEVEEVKDEEDEKEVKYEDDNLRKLYNDLIRENADYEKKIEKLKTDNARLDQATTNMEDLLAGCNGALDRLTKEYYKLSEEKKGVTDSSINSFRLTRPYLNPEKIKNRRVRRKIIPMTEKKFIDNLSSKLKEIKGKNKKSAVVIKSIKKKKSATKKLTGYAEEEKSPIGISEEEFPTIYMPEKKVILKKVTPEKKVSPEKKVIPPAVLKKLNSLTPEKLKKTHKKRIRDFIRDENLHDLDEKEILDEYYEYYKDTLMESYKPGETGRMARKDPVLIDEEDTEDEE